MLFDRRRLVATGLGLGLFSGSVFAKPKPLATNTTTPNDTGLIPDSTEDQSSALQQLIDEAANRKAPLTLPSGRFLIRTLNLRPGTRLVGSAGTTILRQMGGGAMLLADACDNLHLEGLTLDGALAPLDANRALGLLTIRRASGVTVRDLIVQHSLLHGIALAAVAGKLNGCTVRTVAEAGIFSNDAGGLEIGQNTVSDAGNNGILVWRSKQGEDGTIVSGNRIERIRALAGGTGQNGNGINVYRAGNVMVTGNRIADCAYTAIRGNAASNIQMVANNCQRLGEVALYAEFGFQGALIANNIVDIAATGISVTNFNEGGRLAVVQGNLVRNLFRREQEPVDKRGDG
ncbi:MAG: TIGR03808 family TAT-translocated repetitive protein, partial [Hyphomicrobiaceae bacterium]